jgi:hypothetical protein
MAAMSGKPVGPNVTAVPAMPLCDSTTDPRHMSAS